jgi:hypothetical protein
MDMVLSDGGASLSISASSAPSKSSTSTSTLSISRSNNDNVAIEAAHFDVDAPTITTTTSPTAMSHTKMDPKSTCERSNNFVEVPCYRPSLQQFRYVTTLHTDMRMHAHRFHPLWSTHFTCFPLPLRVTQLMYSKFGSFVDKITRCEEVIKAGAFKVVAPQEYRHTIVDGTILSVVPPFLCEMNNHLIIVIIVVVVGCEGDAWRALSTTKIPFPLLQQCVIAHDDGSHIHMV